MPMHNGETVGDMIVRNRKADLKNPHITEAGKAEIRRKPAPRSMRNESWPPR